MASTNQKGGMQSFVHRNDAPAVNGSENAGMALDGSNDELRMHLSGTYTPKQNRSTRANAHDPKAPTQVKAKPGPGRNQALARREPAGQGHFYDTDADSIGDNSTVASMNDHAVKFEPEDQRDEISSEVSDEQESEGEESGSDKATPDRLHQLDRQLCNMAYRPTEGIQSTYIKGDSYPTTTSGNPSVSDAGNGVDTKTNMHAGVHPLQAREVHQGRQLTAPSNANPQGQPPPSAARVGQTKADNAFFVRQTPSDPNDVQRQLNSDFAFAAAPKQQSAATHPPRHTQQTAPGNFAAPRPSTNAAQRSSNARTGERSSDAYSSQQQQVNEPSINTYLPTKLIATKNRQPIQGSREEPTRSLRPAPIAEHLLGVTSAAAYGQTIASEEQFHEPETQLDHDITQLREIDYRALRNEPFDGNPNANGVAIDFGGRDNSITTKLESAKRSPANVQAQVFKFLSIGEWEQAGDWFLDQFGAAVSQLKTVRQQRRKAAKEYEDEIESRVEAVGQKRKQIDMAMSEMKESGGKVLQGHRRKSRPNEHASFVAAMYATAPGLRQCQHDVMLHDV